MRSAAGVDAIFPPHARDRETAHPRRRTPRPARATDRAPRCPACLGSRVAAHPSRSSPARRGLVRSPGPCSRAPPRLARARSRRSAPDCAWRAAHVRSHRPSSRHRRARGPATAQRARNPRSSCRHRESPIPPSRSTTAAHAHARHRSRTHDARHVDDLVPGLGHDETLVDVGSLARGHSRGHADALAARRLPRIHRLAASIEERTSQAPCLDHFAWEDVRAGDERAGPAATPVGRVAHCSATAAGAFEACPQRECVKS